MPAERAVRMPRSGGAPGIPGLPLGRRTPKGRERWYLLRVPEGRERALCEELKRLVPYELLSDAFALRKERWFKRAGEWSLAPVDMYRGYAFAVSPDAAGLSKALSKLTLPVSLVGTETHSWAPLSDEAAAWYESVTDSQHVIRSSTAVIEGGVLRVVDGPLMGQEPRISKVDRHRRRCQVRVVSGEGAFAEQAPLDVPFKS